MKRRTFALTAAAAALPASLLTAWPARAQGAKSYREINPAVDVEAPAGQVEVVEFFSYACPYCKQFEPMLEDWLKTAPKYVTLRRVHVGWNMDGFMAAPLQRIYYALLALGKVDAMQSKVFDALQTEHRHLEQTDVLFPWIATQGIDRAKFEQAYNSFGVANQVQRAATVTNAYQIESTPSMGVAGRFATDPGMANQNFAGMIKTTSTLVEQVHGGK